MSTLQLKAFYRPQPAHPGETFELRDPVTGNLLARKGVYSPGFVKTMVSYQKPDGSLLGHGSVLGSDDRTEYLVRDEKTGLPLPWRDTCIREVDCEMDPDEGCIRPTKRSEGTHGVF